MWVVTTRRSLSRASGTTSPRAGAVGYRGLLSVPSKPSNRAHGALGPSDGTGNQGHRACVPRPCQQRCMFAVCSPKRLAEVLDGFVEVTLGVPCAKVRIANVDNVAGGFYHLKRRQG